MKIDTPEEKLKYVQVYLDKLMRIADNAINKGKYNLALSALSAYCNIQYSINQVYTDLDAEDLVLQISQKIVKVPEYYQGEKNTVLFYDGFGLDLRGWAASFAKALSSLEYDVLYVVPLHSKGKIPHIKKEVEKGNGRIEYIDVKKSYVKHVDLLNSLFDLYKPQTAFFYTTPNDVAGAAVFDAYKDKVKRIQIDLTDHAFWIGINAFDFTIDSRKPGLSNMVFHRGVSKDRILLMDCCPYVNRDIESTPLPFDIENEKYIFSGGSLYKTLGDEQLLFYQIVNHILLTDESIKFLYAGDGDDRELKRIIAKFPGRVFHIKERSDFIRLFENCVFFLNTYPMFGGLMMRYAALVGKVPLTLKHGSDHEGLLKDQGRREIEYETYEDVIAEAERLIKDEAYRNKKESMLSGAVVTEEEFNENVKGIIEQSNVGNLFGDINQIEEVDTRDFRAEYIERLQPENMLAAVIIKRENKRLLQYFPKLFVKKMIRIILK